jgi:hypothetical protein
MKGKLFHVKQFSGDFRNFWNRSPDLGGISQRFLLLYNGQRRADEVETGWETTSCSTYRPSDLERRTERSSTASATLGPSSRFGQTEPFKAVSAASAITGIRELASGRKCLLRRYICKYTLELIGVKKNMRLFL